MVEKYMVLSFSFIPEDDDKVWEGQLQFPLSLIADILEADWREVEETIPTLKESLSQYVSVADAHFPGIPEEADLSIEFTDTYRSTQGLYQDLVAYVVEEVFEQFYWVDTVASGVKERLEAYFDDVAQEDKDTFLALPGCKFSSSESYAHFKRNFEELMFRFSGDIIDGGEIL